MNTPIRFFSRLLQNLMLDCLISLPLPDSCVTIGECSDGWCDVAMFCNYNLLYKFIFVFL